MNDFETIAERYHRICEIHGAYKSIHEGIGMILEEYKELEEEAFKREPDWERVYDESVDLAVTAIRMRDFAIRMRNVKGEEQ